VLLYYTDYPTIAHLLNVKKKTLNLILKIHFAYSENSMYLPEKYRDTKNLLKTMRFHPSTDSWNDEQHELKKRRLHASL
jgi:hypothetical protein